MEVFPLTINCTELKHVVKDTCESSAEQKEQRSPNEPLIHTDVLRRERLEPAAGQRVQTGALVRPAQLQQDTRVHQQHTASVSEAQRPQRPQITHVCHEKG